MITYLVTSGEYSDYSVEAIIQSPVELSPDQLQAIYRAEDTVFVRKPYGLLNRMTVEERAAYDQAEQNSNLAACQTAAALVGATILEYREVNVDYH